MICRGCGQADECRLGFCFDCATAGEARAAARTVFQHVRTGLWHMARGFWFEAKCDFKWAFGRLTKTGDYQHGGYFDREGFIWR